ATCVRYSDVAFTSGVAVLKGGVGVRVAVGGGCTQPAAPSATRNSSSTTCFSMVHLPANGQIAGLCSPSPCTALITIAKSQLRARKITPSPAPHRRKGCHG